MGNITIYNSKRKVHEFTEKGRYPGLKSQLKKLGKWTKETKKLFTTMEG